MSPYGQSVFADAVDAIQAVDLCYDAMMSEIDNGKMRVFLSDVMFDTEHDGKGGARLHPVRQGGLHGVPEGPCRPRTRSTSSHPPCARRRRRGRSGSRCRRSATCAGSGSTTSTSTRRGYLRTATEVSADNSALMRNIRRHEHALEGSLAGICHALLAAERHLGTELPEEGAVRVGFDDSIIADTAAEKKQDMDEVAAGLMQPWEYRAKWYRRGRGDGAPGYCRKRGRSELWRSEPGSIA